MSNPVSLNLNSTELSTTNVTQTEPGSEGMPTPEATFAGLLQNKVAELEIPLEALTQNKDAFEESTWQLLPEAVLEDGKALPEANSIQEVLLVAWQAPEHPPLQAEMQTRYSIVTPPPSTSSLSTNIDTEVMLTDQKVLTPLAQLNQQQNQNANNMVKAFLAIQPDQSIAVEQQVNATSFDLEPASIHTNPSTPSATTSTQARTDVQLQPITIAPTRPEWGNAIGERLQWMANNKIQAAEIRLDPPELGSVEIKIVIHKDTAQVNFVSPHAQVRDAVENAIPRLREMFGETGLSLGDVNVSQESFKQQANDGSEANTHASQATEIDELVIDDINSDAMLGGSERVSRGTGLLDTYV